MNWTASPYVGDSPLSGFIVQRSANVFPLLVFHAWRGCSININPPLQLVVKDATAKFATLNLADGCVALRFTRLHTSERSCRQMYQFVVMATNSNGSSVPSLPSNKVEGRADTYDKTRARCCLCLLRELLAVQSR